MVRLNDINTPWTIYLIVALAFLKISFVYDSNGESVLHASMIYTRVASVPHTPLGKLVKIDKKVSCRKQTVRLLHNIEIRVLH